MERETYDFFGVIFEGHLNPPAFWMEEMTIFPYMEGVPAGGSNPWGQKQRHVWTMGCNEELRQRTTNTSAISDIPAQGRETIFLSQPGPTHPANTRYLPETYRWTGRLSWMQRQPSATSIAPLEKLTNDHSIKINSDYRQDELLFRHPSTTWAGTWRWRSCWNWKF